MRLRGLIGVAVAGLLSAAILPARAVERPRLPPLVGVTEVVSGDEWSGLGLSGYDPVAYLTDGVSRPGSARFEIVHGGVAWRFSTAANRAAFLRDPDRFLPRIGGYDAIAATHGRTIAADPGIFAVRSGRLYLFRTAANRDRFLAAAPAAAAAEAAWRDLSGGLVRG